MAVAGSIPLVKIPLVVFALTNQSLPRRDACKTWFANGDRARGSCSKCLAQAALAGTAAVFPTGWRASTGKRVPGKLGSAGETGSPGNGRGGAPMGWGDWA
ncbi:MAG: hypothetical protein ACKO9Z_07075 [Planctomycetota bacterium]